MSPINFFDFALWALFLLYATHDLDVSPGTRLRELPQTQEALA